MESRASPPGHSEWTGETPVTPSYNSTHALDPGQRLALPVVPNLHQQQQHEHDRTDRDRERKRDVPVGERQVGRDVLHLRTCEYTTVPRMLSRSATANASTVSRNVIANTRAGIPIQRGPPELVFAMLLGYTIGPERCDSRIDLSM